MSRVIKRFSDGKVLEYDRGGFDDWCVYLRLPNGSRTAPKDVDYFAELLQFAGRYGHDRVYADYVQVYELTGISVEANGLDCISQIAQDYDESLQIELMFTILYTAMIAEENKANTRLGKRIKRLGIHKLIYEHAGVQNAANFMRGMGWREIDALCTARGF